MTRAEKFKEVFGLKIDVENADCGFFDCSDRESCVFCLVKYTKSWWNGEYEVPNEPKWIPVSKGLPKPYNDVYLTICANSAYYGFNKNFMKVKCGQYQPQDDKRDWFVDGVRYYFDNVIAWMPYQLPEPYRADREEASDEDEEDDCTDIYCENCRNNYNCIEYLEEQERMNEEDDE